MRASVGMMLLVGGVLLVGLLGRVASGLHSLRYFDVAVANPSPGLPQYVSVGYVDGIPISQYDSESRRVVPKAEWMKSNLEQHYWDSETLTVQGNQEIDRGNLERVRSRYNQSGRAQTQQRMYGCDLLEDGRTRGYYQSAYDGKDFISFDMKTMTFTAADQAAEITKRDWEKDGIVAEDWKNYLETTCIEWLQKYLSYGREVLERKEPPTVRVSGQEAHGRLTLWCRAYGFYPRPISLSWLRDGIHWDQETSWSGIVPNSDGTYYTSASIEVLPEEKDKYQCHVEHGSLAQPGLYAWEPEPNLLPMVLGVVAASVVLISAAALLCWKYNSEKKKQKHYQVAASTEGSSGGSDTGIMA